jgi:ECF transporter S component (folate family)
VFKKGEKRDFWNARSVFALRNLTVMGVMLALGAVLSRFTLYITPTFKGIGFAYLPGALVALLFGPWAAIAYGFLSDAVNYFSNPQGFYFPGYALSEALSYFLYACFLYRRPVSVWRVAAARGLILIFITLGLNCFWDAAMYGANPAGFYTGTRLLNNLIQFPFHAALVLVLGRRALEIFKRRG